MLSIGTWNQPAWKRDAQQEYLDKHIDTAVRFNISEVSDKQSSAPLMLPPPQQFEQQVGKVMKGVCIVIYMYHPAWVNCIGELHVLNCDATVVKRVT